MMKNLSILAALILFLVSCERLEPSVIPSEEPSVTLGEEPETSHGLPMPPSFSSEEEFVEQVLTQRSDAMGINSASENENVYKLDTITHYYKFKNPPPDAIIRRISPTSPVGIIIIYDTQKGDIEGENLHIHYVHGVLYDIEEDGAWAHSIRKGDFNAELDGIKYYIWHGTVDGVPVNWNVEWVNEDGYNIGAKFPYRFTADEVLGYVSDLERVEIG
jgi:hypothetical protein